MADLCGRHSQMGSLAWAAHLLNDARHPATIELRKIKREMAGTLGHIVAISFFWNDAWRLAFDRDTLSRLHSSKDAD